ncbi:MAG TPA: hypothetical protein PK986_01445, partial [Spirochaetota bacterium]|nr:hypothetical protein [Spirochaetota bacterium]
MAAAQTNQPTEIYNMYEEGYRTGAQVSIFIGPIWIEEVVTLEKRTQSGDQPVYPYSSPYYSRLMLGKYKIYGHIGIAYTSTNYLLEIMERARNISIQDSELEEIINRQKNLFQNRLEHRIQNASRAQQIAESYVERISREIEIMGPGGSGIDPREFELTIIRGNLYNQDQSIDIYQDVKIVGTAEQISNDDGVQIELYSYIAKRKPPKNIRRDAAAVRLGLSRDNLLQMTQELTTGLVSSLLTPPSVSVFSVPFRSAKMFNTDRLAMAGIMNDKARFFGKRASFTEVVYAFELKQQFRSNDTGTVPAPLRSQAKLKVVREGVANELDGVYLQPPRKDHGIYFDNSYGKLVAMDREYTAKGITAIGPVTPQPLVNRMGGSICMPRYRRNEFDAGSFIPPQIVQEKDQYIYNDTQLDALTKTTMWNALVGYRGISKSSDNNTNSVESEEESGPSVITEIAQPLVTFAYIDHVKGTFNASGHDYVLEIGAPVYVDYMDTHRKGSKGKATKEELSIGKTDKTVKYTFNRGATEAVESVETTESAYSEYFKDTVMGVFYKEVELGDPLPETPDISHFNPVIFKITDSIDSARLATDFNKCMYVVPFVFIENDTVTVSHGAEHTAVCERETTGENFAPSWYDSNNRKIELLTHFMETREQRDATCDIDFTYDWIVTDASGLSSQGAQFSISGVAFLNPKNNDHTKVRCPECGLELTRESLGIGKKKAHVFFLMMVVPIVRTESDSSSNQQNGVTILHDLDTASGRYMEL